jgi:hypothetical protein
MVIMRTLILPLNDSRLDVRTACERNATKDTPTANANTSQANMLSTPVKSFRRRRDMDVQTGGHGDRRACIKLNLTLRLGFIVQIFSVQCRSTRQVTQGRRQILKTIHPDVFNEDEERSRQTQRAELSNGGQFKLGRYHCWKGEQKLKQALGT